jgi:hypothetical protein
MVESTATANTNKNDHDAVVRKLAEANKKKYTVLTNLDGEQHHVAGLFPDLLLKDSADNLIFIIEVKRNGGISQCLQQWKNVQKLPAVLYIMVPEEDLNNAKQIAQVVGLPVKFGSYKIDSSGGVSVKYE